MATDFPTVPARAYQPGIHNIRQNWGWFLALGILLIVVGTAAIILSVVATLATVLVIGILALVAAVAQLVSAFQARHWEGVVLHLLIAILYGVFGLMLVARPGQGAAALTLLLGALFLVGGIFRVIFALSVRFHSWGWALLSGIVMFLLGALIWSEWPGSSYWVIGLFVGIDMLVTGWTWVILAMGLRTLPEAAPSPVT
jgi:uncharacterized membrane protein HdeD (DUF308 family)